MRIAKTGPPKWRTILLDSVPLLCLAALSKFYCVSGQPETGKFPCQPGLSEECYTGPKGTAGVGECRKGRTLCYEENGTIHQICFDEVTPVPEQCNLKDDDCDGVTDNQGVCLTQAIDSYQQKFGELWYERLPYRTGPILLTRKGWSPLFYCAGMEPVQCALYFIQSNRQLVGLTSDEELSSPRKTNIGGMWTVVFSRVLAGVEIMGAGLAVSGQEDKIRTVQTYLPDIRADVNVTPKIDEETALGKIPPGALISSSRLMLVLPAGLQPENGAGYQLIYRIVYVTQQGIQRLMDVSAETGDVLRDHDTTLLTTTITIDGKEKDLSQIQQKFYNEIDKFLDFVSAVSWQTQGTEVNMINDPEVENSGVFHCELTNSKKTCGKAAPAYRKFWVSKNCAMEESIAHEVSHILIWQYLGADTYDPDQEAIEHGLVEMLALLYKCHRKLQQGAISCYGQNGEENPWINHTTKKCGLAAVATDGYAAVVPKNDQTWTTHPLPGKDFQSLPCNRIIFASPIARAFDWWVKTSLNGTKSKNEVEQEAINQLLHLIIYSVITLPGPLGFKLSGKKVEEVAYHILGQCYNISNIGTVSKELCHILNVNFSQAGLVDSCAFPPDIEICDGLDNNCDGLVDNCTSFQNCCYFRILAGEKCDMSEKIFSQHSLTIGCFSGDLSKANVGECHYGYKICQPQPDGATWSQECIGEQVEQSEVCNDKDDNCDGQTDEGVKELYVADLDGDGYGGPYPPQALCIAPPGYVHYDAQKVDCDDTNNAIHPTAQEVCDGKDNDCDGDVDEPDPVTGDICQCKPEDKPFEKCEFPPSVQGCGKVQETDFCNPGVRYCIPIGNAFGWTECQGKKKGVEICDGYDNDCNGCTDEEWGLVDIDPTSFCVDWDHFTHALKQNEPVPCLGHYKCIQGQKICIGEPVGEFILQTDEEGCDNDNCGYIEETLCDGKDNDCDGLTDEIFDLDKDGYLSKSACPPPLGKDCDDTDPAVSPIADEVCDGKDNDCDDKVDEGCDMDGDGYVSIIMGGNDCNDLDSSIHPGASEICDGKDNDCNGQVDDGLDKDGDGWPACPPESNCSEENWVPACMADCDDSDPNKYPGADEICDGKDNDCDGEVDEPFSGGCTYYYPDNDLDGWASSTQGGVCMCEKPPNMSLKTGDCDDTNPQVNPGATEIPGDGIDNDCNPSTSD